MTLGEMVKRRATEKYKTNMFRRKLSRDCGTSNSTISKIVNDEDFHPDTMTLRKISNTLGIDYLSLLIANKDITEDDILAYRNATSM